MPQEGKTDYITNFEFVGSIDNAPYLCIPAALSYREKIGGEKAILSYCHDLARKAANRAAEILGTEVMENEEGTLGDCCLSNVKLPLNPEDVIAIAKTDAVGFAVNSWLSAVMVNEYGTFMAFIFYGNAWWVRFSAQTYLELKDFEWAAAVLREVSARVLRGEFLNE